MGQMATNTKIINAVAGFCEHAARHPLSFFSEADLQSDLYRRLCDALPKLYRTSVSVSGDGTGTTTFRTSLVHREYGAGGSRRLDLVVFTPEEVLKITDTNLCKLTIDGFEYIRPSYALELGTEKSPNTASHMINDLKKLHDRVTNHGFLLHFYRDTRDVPLNSPRWTNRKERIIDPYRQAIEDGDKNSKSDVTVLAFLLLLGRRDRPKGPRCQVYAPGGFDFTTKKVNGWDNWHWLNLNRVAKAVRYLCKPA